MRVVMSGRVCAVVAGHALAAVDGGWRYGQVLQPVAVERQNIGGVPAQPDDLHVTAPGTHAALIRQVTSHAHADPQLTLPEHAKLPVQLTLHAPVPQATVLAHDWGPLQVTLQAPWPHVTFLQVCRPLHAIVHDVALPQRTLLHWLVTEHATLQLQPAGHVTVWSQAPLLSMQSIVQLFLAASHEVHCDGQTAASPSGGGVSPMPESTATTQNPSTQVRPSAQRCSASQAKSPLRWLTEQLTASARARAVVQSASFTASLPG